MENQEKYMISIIGEQCLDGETDKVEVLTSGNFMRKRDHFYIGYKEYSEDNPAEYYDNLIKVEKNMVTINRRGQNQTRLMLEKGRRHQCVYQTVAGDFTIGVFTKTLINNLTDNGGTLEVSYTLDFDANLMSENRFFIKVEEKTIEE